MALLAEGLDHLRSHYAEIAVACLSAAGLPEPEAVSKVTSFIIDDLKKNHATVYTVWRQSTSYAKVFSTLPELFQAVFRVFTGPISASTTLTMWRDSIASVSDFLDLSVVLHKLNEVADALARLASLPALPASQLAIALVEALAGKPLMSEQLHTRVRQSTGDFALTLRENTLDQFIAGVEALAKDQREARTFSSPPAPNPSKSGSLGSDPAGRGRGRPSANGPAPPSSASPSPATVPAAGSRAAANAARGPDAFARNHLGSAENPTPARFCVYCLSKQTLLERGRYAAGRVGLKHNFASCRTLLKEPNVRAQYLELARVHENAGTTPEQALQIFCPTAAQTPAVPRADSFSGRLSGPRVLYTAPGPPPQFSTGPPGFSAYPGSYPSWGPSAFSSSPGPPSHVAQPSALVAELLSGAAGYHSHGGMLPVPSSSSLPPSLGGSAHLYSSAPATSGAPAGGPGSSPQGNEPPLRN